MNTCYKRLAYPNPKSIDVMERVNRVLPRHVIRPQSSELKQQALFLLLGEDFTEHHFPKEKYNVKMLDPPKLDPKLKRKYIKEMKVFLNDALLNAMEDCGYPRDLSKYKTSDDEMGRYIKEIRGTYSDAFATHIRQDAFKNESKNLRRRKRSDKYSMFYDESDDEDEDDYDYDTLDEVGVTYTPEADAAGRSFLDFMDHESAKNVDYKKIIRDRLLCLPLSLRQFFWWQFFEKKEKERLDLKSGETLKAAILKDFEEKLKVEMKKQKLSIATKSVNAKRIDSHVIEMFDMSPPLKDLDFDDVMIKTTLALNMAGIHSDNYSPVKGLLFFPLQIVFKKKEKETEEQYMTFLAATLTYLDKYCELTQKELFKMADEIIRMVDDDDPKYLDHIEKCLKTQSSKARPMDFPPEVLLQDTRAGVKVYNNLLKYGAKGEEDVKERYMDEFCDPAIFIRKWLAQLFVGVLSINGMMWAWDQMFLKDWSRTTIKNIAVSILALIRPWMLRATMYSGARKVFVEEPSKLYTSDLQNALGLLGEGCLFTQIPQTKNFKKGAANTKQKLKPSKKVESDDEEDDEDDEEDEDEDDEEKEDSPPPSPVRKKKKEKDHPLLKPAFQVPVLPLGANPNFDLSFHLQDNPNEEDADADNPGPVREPLPDSDDDDDDEPPRKRDPNEPDTPPDTPPPPLTSDGWVEQDPDPVNPPEPSRINDPFDFYVDYVRFLPDNIRLCKVTGRIINSKLSKEGYKDLVTYPLLESYQRSPAFRYKQKINPEGETINPDTVIVLKVYGYEGISNEIAIVGSCLIGPFERTNHKYTLKAGGHQLRLRHGGPNPTGGSENLRETDMDHNSPIPGVSICIRLLKSDKIYDPTPKYEDGYYDTSPAKPNPTELRLFEHYMNDRDYTTLSVGEELRFIQKRTGHEETKDAPELQKYLVKLLNHLTVQRKKKSPIPDMNYSYFVKYDPKLGVNVCIQGAFGLPDYVEGYYTHAFGEILPGRKSLPDIKDRDRKRLQVVTRRHDLTSFQRSPDWLDAKTTLYPPYDTNSVLLVQVYGIKLKYIPKEDDDEGRSALQGGTVEEDGRDGFKIDYNEPLLWSIMTIFEDGYARGGLHLLAVFEGKPKREVLLMFEKDGPAEDVLQKCIAQRLITPEKNGFLEVEIYDGHIESEDIPEPAIDIQLEALGIAESALKARALSFRKKIGDFVLENMNSTDRSKGITGSKFKKEGFTFQEEACTQFTVSLNKALEKVGKPGMDLS